MLSIPLDSQRQRNLSVSSLEDEDHDHQKLIATIDEQKRAIRKLRLKVAKLEELLEKQRAEQTKPKEPTPLQPHQAPHFEMLKREIEKSDILEGTVYKIAGKINEIALDMMGQMPEGPFGSWDRGGSIKNGEDLVGDNPEHQRSRRGDIQTFMTMNRCFQQLNLLHSAWIRYRQLIAKLKRQNSEMQGSLIKSAELSKKVLTDTDELREIKLQFENQRRYCAKLKRLLQKSEYQRNRMMVRIDQLSLSNRQNTPNNNEELLKLSKSLTYKITSLQKEKSEIIRQNLKQKEGWAKKYKQFLKMVKLLKKKDRDD